MRHFEDFEIEHLLNSTGSFLLRFRCAQHLKKCPLCRQRKARLMEENFLAGKVREAVRSLEGFRKDQKENLPPESSR